MTTEFDDANHYGIFTTNPTLTSSTGKYARQSEIVLSALRAQGVFDNLVDGTTAPATDKLWLDKNSDPAVLKEYDSVGSAWSVMTFDRLFGRAIVTNLENVGGSANAITVDEPATFIDNRLYALTPAANNTGAATLLVTGVGTYDVLYHDGSAIAANELVSGRNTVLLFTSGRFEVLQPVATVYASELATIAAKEAAEAARDEAVAAAASLSIVTTEAEFLAALSSTGVINVSSDVSEVALTTSTQVEDLRAKFPLIGAEGPLTINLPSNVNTVTSGNILKISSRNANIRLIGAAPTETNATSVTSVTGSAGNWLVTYAVASESGFTVGRLAKIFDARPLPILSGDNVAPNILDDRPLLGEMAIITTNCGTATITSSGSTVVYAGGSGDLSDSVSAGYLVTLLGQSLEVTTVDDGTNTLTVNGTWAQSASGVTPYITRRANGTISTSGSSQTVTGLDTVATTQATVGGMLLAAGQLVKITAIASNTSFTVDKPIDLSAGTVFSFLHPHAGLHQGIHEVTAVASGSITVRNESQLEPPINGVTIDEIRSINTVFFNTGDGDGIVCGQNGAIEEIDNIAFVGAGASNGSVGLLPSGRIESEIAGDGVTDFGTYTQHGLNATLLFGENCGFTRWFRGFVIGNQCDVDLRKAAVNANLNFGGWVLENGSANCRRTQFISNGSIGLITNAGSVTTITEALVIGNGSDGGRFDGFIRGEAPMFVANAVMNFRLGDQCLGHMTDGVSFLALASGGRAEGATIAIDRMAIGANGRAGLEGTKAARITGDEIWLSGTSNTAGSGHGLDLAGGSLFSGTSCVLDNNEGTDIVLGLGCSAIVDGAIYTSYAGVSELNTMSRHGSILVDGNGGEYLGTSTPGLSAGGGSIGAISAVGLNWTRDRNRYRFDARATITTVGTATGYLDMSAPFTAAAPQACFATNVTQGKICAALITGSTIRIYRGASVAFPAEADGDIIIVSGDVRV